MLYERCPYGAVKGYIYSTISNLGNQSEDLGEAEDLVTWGFVESEVSEIRNQIVRKRKFL